VLNFRGKILSFAPTLVFIVGMGAVHARVPNANRCGNSAETCVAIIGPMCRDHGDNIRERKVKGPEELEVEKS
jgi:hypothetical protein